MLRLSKLTDYGIVVLAHLARDAGPAVHNARELAGEVDLPAPVVSKVLKGLARHGVLESQRGAKGGYALRRPPSQVSVAEIIDVLEGPVAITECAVGAQLCQHEEGCAVRGPWQLINGVLREALARITLADLIDPAFAARPANALHVLTGNPARPD